MLLVQLAQAGVAAVDAVLLAVGGEVDAVVAVGADGAGRDVALLVDVVAEEEVEVEVLARPRAGAG